MLLLVPDYFIEKPKGIFRMLNHTNCLLLSRYFVQGVQDLEQVCNTLPWYMNIYAWQYKVILKLLVYHRDHYHVIKWSSNILSSIPRHLLLCRRVPNFSSKIAILKSGPACLSLIVSCSIKVCLMAFLQIIRKSWWSIRACVIVLFLLSAWRCLLRLLLLLLLICL